MCSNLSSECVLSKTFRPRLKILYRSKVIFETVTEGHFSTHFLSDYVLWITRHYRFIYPKFDFKITDLAILEKYFRAKFLCESLNFHFYAPPSAHNWNPYFGLLGGTDSNDNNSLDFHRKITKFVFKFNLRICTFEKIRLRLKIPYP